MITLFGHECKTLDDAISEYLAMFSGKAPIAAATLFAGDDVRRISILTMLFEQQTYDALALTLLVNQFFSSRLPEGHVARVYFSALINIYHDDDVKRSICLQQAIEQLAPFSQGDNMNDYCVSQYLLAKLFFQGLNKDLNAMMRFVESIEPEFSNIKSLAMCNYTKAKFYEAVAGFCGAGANKQAMRKYIGLALMWYQVPVAETHPAAIYHCAVLTAQSDPQKSTDEAFVNAAKSGDLLPLYRMAHTSILKAKTDIASVDAFVALRYLYMNTKRCFKVRIYEQAKPTTVDNIHYVSLHDTLVWNMFKRQFDALKEWKLPTEAHLNALYDAHMAFALVLAGAWILEATQFVRKHPKAAAKCYLKDQFRLAGNKNDKANLERLHGSYMSAVPDYKVAIEKELTK